MVDFVLGRLKFTFLGEWQTAYDYIKDDIVRYGGNAFACIDNHTSSADFYTDSSKWSKITAGTDFKGEWATATLYKVDDIVKWGGITYVCNTGHTSQTSLYDDESKWTQYNSGFDWKGNYSGGTEYKNNDVVKYGASTYICVEDHTAPSELDTTKWNTFASGLEFEDSWNSTTQYQIGDIVTYGGYNYVAARANINVIPYNNTTDWEILSTGFKARGYYDNATAYSPGDLVRFGGHSYTAKVDTTGNKPTANNPDTYWELVTEGFRWGDTWTDATEYAPGDAINFGSSAYRAKVLHTSNTVDNRPDLDTTGQYWDLIAEGDSNFVLTAQGDILTRNATQNVRLPIGTEGTVLRSNGTDVEWAYAGGTVLDNIWYVAPNGTDDTAPGRGQSPDRAYGSIAYACSQTSSVTGNKTIFVKTGTYQEQLPIVVPANTALIGDEMRSVRVQPAAGLSNDGVTPNNETTMFLMNNATTIRGMSFQNMIGSLSAPDANGISRPQGGVVISLDPNGSITTQSPYVQNCSSFGDGCVGIKVDGGLQTGGYHSILANDFTQIISDGIGVWVTNGGRSEIVSVFTYYCYIGYLAEDGGTIRALNSNNSYGEYGSMSIGVDANETPYNANVNNRNNEAQIGRVLVGDKKAIRVEFEYAGENYTTGAIAISGAGAGAAVTPVFSDGAVKHVDVTSAGDNYLFTTSNAQGGNTTSVVLALSEPNTDDYYNGMRITIVDGTGYGQTGIIDDYTGATRTATIINEAGNPGFDTFGVNGGNAVEAALDTSTKYEIEPRVQLTGGGSPTRTALARAKVNSSKIEKILILDGGEGYSSAPSVTITDPNATVTANLTSFIGDGVISQATITNGGGNYVQNTTSGTVTGDGYADILQVGNSMVVSSLPQEPKGGTILQFASDTTTSYIVSSVIGYDSVSQTAQLIISPTIAKAVAPPHGDTITFREKYSSCRVTGHDFLDIGTGGFGDTNYPGAPAQTPNQDLEVKEFDRGRVFFTSTDQDGNFRVGGLFQVEQATGKATLNADAFDLSGLQELSLGSVALGSFGATISEFSTDGTFQGNSDNVLVTEKAIKTYVDTQLGGGENNLAVNELAVANIQLATNQIVSTGVGDINLHLATQGNGIINLDAQTQISTAPTVDNDVVNKAYADSVVMPAVQMIKNVNGVLTYVEATTYNAPSQTTDTTDAEDFFFETEGVSMSINETNGHLLITV